MFKSTSIKLYVFAILFIIVNMIFIYNESYLMSLVPFAVAFILFAFSSLRQLMLILVFCAPISIELSEFIPGSPINMSLPTEPILFGIMGIFFLKLITEKRFDKRVLTHPITLAIYAYLIWLFITTLTSEMPLVSFKYFLARVWFIISFYLLITQLVADRKYISKYIWAYTFGMLLAVAFTITNHALEGFTQEAAHSVMNPLFKDHTSYGAALALLLPAVFVLLRFQKKDFNIRFLHSIIIIILLVALVLSYTRAAWVGIVAIMMVWAAVKLKIKFRSLLIVGAVLAAVLVPMANEIMFKMSKNNEVSSTDLGSHVKSMSNISTDASNLERINRWKCALRMFEERPVLGWGPGTYMFLYAPFQHSEDRTIISTNAADLGNAHSEYLGILSEAGFLGTTTFVIIVFLTLITGFRVYHRSNDAFVKEITLYLLMGLITYYLHGFLNNFLDMDKIASLFWGFTAIIVVFDIELKEKKKIKSV